MATTCLSCGKSKNLMNAHLFRDYKDAVFCVECYEKEHLKDSKKELDIIVTSTDSIEGYRITRYLGVESCEVVIGTGIFGEFVSDLNDFFGERSTNFEKKLQEAKQIVFKRLKKKAVDQGANAIVGVDLDYTEFSSNKIGIIASGSLVVIESQK